MRRKPQSRLGGKSQYMDEFLGCRSAPDMIEMGLFPNAKEVTESFAAYEAVRKELFRHFQFADERIVLVSVGDGGTPRTAATFAYRSRWMCHSVDPVLGKKTRWLGIRRLRMHAKPIEDCQASDFGINADSLVIVVAVHSHAPMDKVMSAIGSPKKLGIVALPCCVPLTLPLPTKTCYHDKGIWSPQDTVSVWEL